MIELHPAVQHLEDKGYERGSMEEMAIVHLMRSSLVRVQDDAKLLQQWLQEENPLGLKGPALSEWATEIAEWVLPTQLRRHSAATTGIEQDGDQQQHQEGDGSRQATEASRRHSAEQSQSNEASSTSAGQ